MNQAKEGVKEEVREAVERTKREREERKRHASEKKARLIGEAHILWKETEMKATLSRIQVLESERNSVEVALEEKRLGILSMDLEIGCFIQVSQWIPTNDDKLLAEKMIPEKKQKRQALISEFEELFKGLIIANCKHLSEKIVAGLQDDIVQAAQADRDYEAKWRNWVESLI